MAWFNKLDGEVIIRMLAEGASSEQIGRAINRPRSSVARYCRRHSLYGSGFQQRKFIHLETSGPHFPKPRLVVDNEDTGIRPSMFALAEFDPVIARALATRLRRGV